MFTSVDRKLSAMIVDAVDDISGLVIGAADGRTLFIRGASDDRLSFDCGWLPLGKPWNMPHDDATGYEMSMSHPVVEGRLYLRGADGIYCWDLRKQTDVRETR